MARRMKLTVAYMGRDFHGWQRQRGQRTVQGELENALRSLTGAGTVSVVGAGRTDAGVHATGQTAHVDLETPIPPKSLMRALNHRLPPAIKVRSAAAAGPSFHARGSALGKLYTYRMRWRDPSLPWLELRSATVKRVTDPEALAEAIRRLPGRRDWASFTVPGPGPSSTVRTLFRINSRPRNDGIDLDFIGEGFLRYQVRRMVGALLEVGWKQRSIDDLSSLLLVPRPGAAVWTAPASGLTLERVYYRRSPLLCLE
ncbi:MAG: tRNA pseudouridine(38-40) synthase TruA [Thermoanaerobaculales bacterium]